MLTSKTLNPFILGCKIQSTLDWMLNTIASVGSRAERLFLHLLEELEMAKNIFKLTVAGWNGDRPTGLSVSPYAYSPPLKRHCPNARRRKDLDTVVQYSYPVRVYEGELGFWGVN